MDIDALLDAELGNMKELSDDKLGSPGVSEDELETLETLETFVLPEKDDESVAEVGVHWATEQCRDLLDSEVDGIHFYTLNKSDATLRIHRALGVRSSRRLRNA